MIDQRLQEYIQDPSNPDLNYNLALEYKKVGQSAAAISYFLRAAERTKNLNFSYECLIHIGECFDLQKNRANAVTGAYKHAIATLPQRPEAYYMLANYQNWNQQYQAKLIL